MFRQSSSFDKLLEKATTNLKLEPDWPVILQICDMIRQGDVQPRLALQAIKKKMTQSNPHVVMFALNVLESCVKNCGAPIHDEIGTKAYMESLREMIKTTSHDNVKNKLLELIQAWAHAFRNVPKYRAVQDTVNILKADGYKFPVLKESDAMFSADSAPEWADGECCHRCRVQFGVLQRKHHCRACGQVFCAQCTAKLSTLPKFGIEKEVRVCDSCYDKVNKPSSASSTKGDDLPMEYVTSSLAQQSQAPPPRKSEAELKEEEDLQLAIALSQSEAEVKHNVRLAVSGNNAQYQIVENKEIISTEGYESYLLEEYQLQPEKHQIISIPASENSKNPSPPPLSNEGKPSDDIGVDRPSDVERKKPLLAPLSVPPDPAVTSRRCPGRVQLESKVRAQRLQAQMAMDAELHQVLLQEAKERLAAAIEKKKEAEFWRKKAEHEYKLLTNEKD